MIDNTTKKDRNTGFRVTEERLRFLQDVALKRRIKVQGLIEKALAAYLADSPESTIAGAAEKQENTPQFPSKDRHWHELLQLILDSGLPIPVRAVTSNIEMFHEYVEVQRERTSAEGETGGAAKTKAPPDGARNAPVGLHAKKRPADG